MRKNDQSRSVLLPHTDLEYVDAKWGQLTWFANVRLGNTDYLTLDPYILYKGQSNPRYYYPNYEEILTLIQGRICHTWINGAETELNEWDTITIPVGMWHHACNIGTGNAV